MQIDKSSIKYLGTLTVDKLRALADREKVTLNGRLKADIVKEISRQLKAAAKKVTAKSAKTVKKTVKKKAVVSPAKKKTASKKAAVKKKVTAKKAVAKKTASKKATPKKVVTKKSAAKKAAPKKAAVKKVVAKKVPTKKVAAKKAVSSGKAKTKKPSVVGTTAARPPATVRPEKAASKRTNNKPKRGAARNNSTLAPMAPVATDSGAWASAIAVEPGRVFVSWDIAEKSLRRGERLVLRVVDLSAIEAHGMDSEGAYIQVPLKKSNGGMFLRVMAGRRFEAVVGKMTMEGSFIPFVSAQTVGTPPGRSPQGESLLDDEHFAFSPSGKDPLSSY